MTKFNQPITTLQGYGHPKNAGDDDLPVALSEASICCRTSSELRSIAAFLLYAADRMDRNSNFDHAHLCDFMNQPELRESFDIVVCKV